MSKGTIFPFNTRFVYFIYAVRAQCLLLYGRLGALNFLYKNSTEVWGLIRVWQNNVVQLPHELSAHDVGMPFEWQKN